MSGYPADFKMLSRDKIMLSLYEYPLLNIAKRIAAFITGVAQEQGLVPRLTDIHSTYYRGKFWYSGAQLSELSTVFLDTHPGEHIQLELTGMATKQMAKLVDERNFILDEKETLYHFITMTMNKITTLTDLYKILPTTIYKYIPFKIGSPDQTISQSFIDEFKHKNADIISIIKERLAVNLLLKGTDYS